MRFASQSKLAGPKVARKTVNRAGGEAYVQSDKMSLVGILNTSMLKDQFYRSANETVKEVLALVDKVDPEFAAKAAIYARNESGMRSITHLLASEVVHRVKGKEWVRRFLKKVVRRPDDILEILACYMIMHNGNRKSGLPSRLKRGLADAFGQFDEYQIAKYRKQEADFNLIDAVNILHPRGAKKGNPAISKLMEGELKPAETFEVKLTQTKGDEKKKTEAWSLLILEQRIGYFALLKNLRNIIESCGDDEQIIDKACQILTNRKMIGKSLVLPFRFLTALKALSEMNGPAVRKFTIAISKAIDISLANLPRFEGRTLIVLDTSMSMMWGGHLKDNFLPAEIAGLFAAALVKELGADFLTFDNNARYQNLDVTSSVVGIASMIQYRGGGTNFHSIFQTINAPYDRIMILSDQQGWAGGRNVPTVDFNRYKQRFGVSPRLFCLDPCGYGSLEFPEQNIFYLPGFSDKTLPMLEKLDKDKAALIKEIESIQL